LFKRHFANFYMLQSPFSPSPVQAVACRFGLGQITWYVSFTSSPTCLIPLDPKFVHAAMLSGHEDWVRSLAFLDPPADGQPLILASASQDATIRLWTIEPWVTEMPNLNRPTETLSDELLDAFEASLGDLGDGEEGGRQISLKRHILTVKESQGR
jgi:WD40 repeat protein